MSARRQLGMTLLELMVSITIGLFLVGGLFTVFVSVRSTHKSQTGITQLQDDQRMSMAILSEVVQTAGYYGSVQTQLAQQAFPASSPFTISGQFVFGTSGADASSPDALYVRFQSAPNDGVVNCQGGTNTSSATVSYTNMFTVASSTLQLTCALNGGAAMGLVGGVNASGSATTACSAIGYQGINNIKFLYGVDPNGTGSVTQYSVASDVSNWQTVHSVRATVSMLYCTQTGVLPQQVQFTRLIFLPNQQ